MAAEAMPAWAPSPFPRIAPMTPARQQRKLLPNCAPRDPVGKAEKSPVLEDKKTRTSRGSACCLRRRLLRLHQQAVVYGKHAWHAVGAYSGHVLVSLVVHHPSQRDVSIHHDDVN